ncbi:hypothetical protein F2P81_005415 [Scophthalmus maximus]|uniref:Uncharacterized protein n=1 Tax=Scophthalmus maximus TaxID=52904 RepID=A0A6A4T774_SCOMX|nr:hypothetical protein F2P81_005415 [Scophthalmus maximus]
MLRRVDMINRIFLDDTYASCRLLPSNLPHQVPTPSAVFARRLLLFHADSYWVRGLGLACVFDTALNAMGPNFKCMVRIDGACSRSLQVTGEINTRAADLIGSHVSLPPSARTRIINDSVI